MEGDKDIEKYLDNNKKKGRQNLLQKFQNQKESKVVNQKKESAILTIQKY